LIGIRRDSVKQIEDFSSELKTMIAEKQPMHGYRTLREVIGDLPSLESGQGSDELVTATGVVYNHYVFEYEKKTLERIKAVPQNGGLQDIPDELLSNHLMKMKHGGYGSGGFVKNLYGRLDWDKPSGTIVAGIKKITCGRFFHPTDSRLLTVREVARLQTFPDDYKFSGGLIDQYTVVGNAVPPKFSEFIGNVILAIYLKWRRD
jgi:DNA (cytosine-5)-methyltransferase 1